MKLKTEEKEITDVCLTDRSADYSTWFSYNIAFDLDGVIFPIEDFRLTEGRKFFR